MSFSTLGLSAELLRAVSEEGYSEPTPIQQQAIPCILTGRDLMAGARTGTGKTAGFTLPMLQKLCTENSGKGWRPIRALVLVPTRELAAQVKESVTTYGKYVRVRTAAIFGGVGMNPQVGALRRGVDILVATPGRLQDHIDQRTVDLSEVEMLVLDEADRMLDMGFLPAVQRILKALPQRRQNMLFSATLSDEIRKLASGFLRNPESIQIERSGSAADGVNQVVHPVDRDRKRELLAHLIREGDWRQVLVFTRMKFGADRLSKQLEKDGISSAAIHGNRSQNQRIRALEQFRKGSVRVLVATDVASRGLDIEQLPHVVNYEMPTEPEAYVHRIGRTGRAGMTGEAVSLVSLEERGMLKQIEHLLKKQIPQSVVPGFELDPNARPAPEPKQQRGQHRNGDNGRQNSSRHRHEHRGDRGNRQRRDHYAGR